MFACSSCTRRLCRAVLSVHASTTPTSSRQISTTSHRNETRVAQPTDRTFSIRRHRPTSTPNRDDKARTHSPPASSSRSHLEQVARNAAEKAQARRKKAMRHLKTELAYLEDPLKLADFVKSLLEDKGDTDKALAMVRVAVPSKAYVVSWNHILDHLLKKGKAKTAFSIYNEMKKRNQRPDNYTYTILLRGLADNVSSPSSLGRALALYHSMRRPNSRITPNHFHTNAVLKVCARANDLDSMWDILSQLPERGPLAPDALTFTILFNALRMQALVAPQGGETTGEQRRRCEEAIVEGRKLWPTIIERSVRGELKLDEGSITAMGRLLLVGNRPRDWDDVFSLLRQTMNIPRLQQRLGTAQLPSVDADAEDGVGESQEQSGLVEVKHVEDLAGNEFEVYASRAPRNQSSNTPAESLRFRVFTKPGNSTLSLLTEVCLKLQSATTADAYYRLLTDRDGYDITPDADNVNMMLRIFRQEGDSRGATKFMKEISERYKMFTSAKGIRIAMEACVRDKDAAVALKSADKLLDLILNAPFKRTEITALRQYLEVVQRSESLDVMIRAIKRLNPKVVNLRSILGTQDADEDQAVDAEVTDQTRHDAIRFLSTLAETYTKVLNSSTQATAQSGLFDEEELTRRAAKIRDYIKRIEKQIGADSSRLPSKQVAPFTKSRMSMKPSSEEEPDEQGGKVFRDGKKIFIVEEDDVETDKPTQETIERGWSVKRRQRDMEKFLEREARA